MMSKSELNEIIKIAKETSDKLSLLCQKFEESIKKKDLAKAIFTVTIIVHLTKMQLESIVNCL